MASQLSPGEVKERSVERGTSVPSRSIFDPPYCHQKRDHAQMLILPMTEMMTLRAAWTLDKSHRVDKVSHKMVMIVGFQGRVDWVG
jgi:hypothetical protein